MTDSYYAKWHLRFGGAIIRPGEVFEASDRDPELVRLLELGAAARCGEPMPETAQEEAPVQPAPMETEPDPMETEPDPMEIDVMDGITSAPKSKGRRR